MPKNNEEIYLYHCTTLRNLFHILKEKEPRIQTTCKVINKISKKKLDIRNFNTNVYKQEDTISFSINEPRWAYGSVCFKVPLSKLDKKHISYRHNMTHLLPNGILDAKKQMPKKLTKYNSQELHYTKCLSIDLIEEIYYSPVIEYFQMIIGPTIFIIGLFCLAVFIGQTIGGII